MLTLGNGCSVEPEVDLTGHWLDGDVLHIGTVTVGAGARVGTRSTLCPGAVVRRDAEVAPGSAVVGEVAKGEYWTGSPAEPVGRTRGPWSLERPAVQARWVLAYAAVATLIALLPIAGRPRRPGGDPAVAARHDLVVGSGAAADSRSCPLVALVWLVVLAALVVLLVRLLAIGLAPGAYPMHSLRAWQAWATMQVLDEARTWLFPIYASTFTPVWLRLLGATVGRRVEASTVLLIPKLTSINDEAFLADDTLLGSYELGGGWLRVEHTKIGKRAFVGNSGMTAPGRKVPKQSLVAVLSAAPRRKKAKAGSSWLGSPPMLLRRPVEDGDDSRTYDAAAPAEGRPGPGRVLPVAAGDGPFAPRRRRGPGAAEVLGTSLPWLAAAGGRAAADGRRRGRRRCHLGGQVAAGRAGSGDRPPALELVRVAQRAGRHLRGGGGRAVVRARGDRHPGAERLAALAGRPRRPRRVVRDLLAARAGPGRTCATGSPSTRAASCRPTCSTTGC